MTKRKHIEGMHPPPDGPPPLTLGQRYAAWAASDEWRMDPALRAEIDAIRVEPVAVAVAEREAA